MAKKLDDLSQLAETAVNQAAEQEAGNGIASRMY